MKVISGLLGSTCWVGGKRAFIQEEERGKRIKGVGERILLKCISNDFKKL